MSERRDRGGDDKGDASAEREARLAKALRDNLRRRKAPARKDGGPPQDASEER